MSRLAWCARIALIVVLLMVSVPRGADAQSAASISGVVKDTEGAVMPGVSVVIKNDASGASQEVTTDGEGRYQVTALGAGSYTVTATLSGFKVATSKNIRLAPGQPVSIPLTLEIGQLEETVVVTSSSELINTENGTVAATLNSDQLTRMPTATRNALNAVAFLPGVNTTGTNRDSTINGLPENFLSITLDGVSNNDNFLRNTDGFFASVTPRQDAVEAVSVTLSAAGAQVGGGAGAVTMAFQTRSGGNRFTGSAYEYLPEPRFQHELRLQRDQPSAEERREAEPVRRARRRSDHDSRACTTAATRRSSSCTTSRFASRTASPAPARSSIRASTTAGSAISSAAKCARSTCSSWRRANGQISAMDPTSMSLQAKIDAATKTAGTRSANSDPLYDNYVWQSPSELFEHQPTVRLDYNLTDNHRLNGSWSTITAKRTPDYLNNADPRFPGAPNQRDFVSTRPLLATALRSVIGKTMVNELRGGLTAYASGSNFGYPSSITSRNDPSTFADSGGFAITTPGNTTDWFTSNTPELAQSADLQRGRHADVEQGRAHDPDGRQRVHLERLVLRPDHGPRDHARVQPGLRSGGMPVQHDEFSRRLQRPADGGA